VKLPKVRGRVDLASLLADRAAAAGSRRVGVDVGGGGTATVSGSCCRPPPALSRAEIADAPVGGACGTLGRGGGGGGGGT